MSQTRVGTSGSLQRHKGLCPLFSENRTYEREDSEAQYVVPKSSLSASISKHWSLTLLSHRVALLLVCRAGGHLRREFLFPSLCKLSLVS